MAGTVQTGNVSTEDVLSDERKIDMNERIQKLDPNDTQFTTMTSRLSSRVAVREKVNWLEEDDFPRLTSSVNAQLAGDTSITVPAGNGKIVAANDLLRNMRTGESIRVTVVATDTLTVV